VLFVAGFGKRVSRGSQGVGNSLLIPQRDKERPRGEGKGVSLPTRGGKGSGKRLAKSTLLFATFSFKEKVAENKVRKVEIPIFCAIRGQLPI